MDPSSFLFLHLNIIHPFPPSPYHLLIFCPLSKNNFLLSYYFPFSPHHLLPKKKSVSIAIGMDGQEGARPQPKCGYNIQPPERKEGKIVILQIYVKSC